MGWKFFGRQKSSPTATGEAKKKKKKKSSLAWGVKKSISCGEVEVFEEGKKNNKKKKKTFNHRGDKKKKKKKKNTFIHLKSK